MSGAAPAEEISDEESNRREQQHYQDVLRAFKFYRQHAEERIARAKRSYVPEQWFLHHFVGVRWVLTVYTL